MRKHSENLLSYLETALWSSTDSEGTPLDSGFSIEDFSKEALDRAEKDLSSFLEKAGSILDPYSEKIAAHDFWLTRNGHGAGFWDGDYQEQDGERLTALAHSFGESSLYLGDDGVLYLDRP